MTQVLNLQTDAIVLVCIEKQQTDKNNENPAEQEEFEEETKSNLLFCNNKSTEMFGCNHLP